MQRNHKQVKKHKVFVSFCVFFLTWWQNRHAYYPQHPMLVTPTYQIATSISHFHPKTRIEVWRAKDHEYFSVLSHSLGQELETAEMF